VQKNVPIGQIQKRIEFLRKNKLNLKMKNKKTINVSDKELDRDIRNLSIPIEDQHIPIEEDSFFEGIYGKEAWDAEKIRVSEKFNKK